MNVPLHSSLMHRGSASFDSLHIWHFASSTDELQCCPIFLLAHLMHLPQIWTLILARSLKLALQDFSNAIAMEASCAQSYNARGMLYQVYDELPGWDGQSEEDLSSGCI